MLPGVAELCWSKHVSLIHCFQWVIILLHLQSSLISLKKKQGWEFFFLFPHIAKKIWTLPREKEFSLPYENDAFQGWGILKSWTSWDPYGSTQCGKWMVLWIVINSPTCGQQMEHHALLMFLQNPGYVHWHNQSLKLQCTFQWRHATAKWNRGEEKLDFVILEKNACSLSELSAVCGSISVLKWRASVLMLCVLCPCPLMPVLNLLILPSFLYLKHQPLVFTC